MRAIFPDMNNSQRTPRIRIILLLLCVCVSSGASLNAHAQPRQPVRRIGLIASLSGFAAPWGVAVKEGAELAVEELKGAGRSIELFVEDDQSETAKVLPAYRSLRDIRRIELLVGGSWWVRPLAQITERDGLPLLSCETLEDADFVPSRTYFILLGRVADWVRVYEPLFRARGWRRAATVQFTSGLAQTIADEMRRIFAGPERSFVGSFQYQEIQFPEAGTTLLRLKRAQPDVVYLDGQPGGIVNFLRRRAELKLQEIPVVTHEGFGPVVEEGLLDLQQARNVYYLRRTPPDPGFAGRFEAKFKHPPVLNADLGYYAVYMAQAALETRDPLAALRAGSVVQGKELRFDKNQVASGTAQEVYAVGDGGVVGRVEAEVANRTGEIPPG